MKRIALIAMLCASPSWAEVGRVVQSEGGVIIRGTDTIVAEEGTLVDQGDLLQTTPFGLIHVLLNDDTKFVVGPGTAISIDTALIGASDSTFENLAVGMTGGLFRMITGNSESEAYEVNTPIATLGVRGTAFDTCLSREFLLIMHQGSVRTCLLDPVTGQPDLDTCADTEAEENSCPVVTASENAGGDRSIGLANSSAILQCRLAYQQDELGVLEDFRVDDLACRAAAETALQNVQPDAVPSEEVPPPQEEDETENSEPSNGEDEASDTRRRTTLTTSRLPTRGGGGGGRSTAGGDAPEAACSKSVLLATFEGRSDYYEGLIKDSTEEAAILGYTAALRTLRSIIRDLEKAALTGDDCDRLLALLTTPCAPPASPATPQDRCIIAGLNNGFGAGPQEASGTRE